LRHDLPQLDRVRAPIELFVEQAEAHGGLLMCQRVGEVFHCLPQITLRLIVLGPIGVPLAEGVPVGRGEWRGAVLIKNLDQPSGQRHHREDVESVVIHDARHLARIAAADVVEVNSRDQRSVDVVLIAVHVEDGEALQAVNVLVATGRSGERRRLGVPGEAPPRVYHRLLDARDFRGRDVLVAGGGGYHVENTVRGWALAWRTCCGESDEADFMGMGGVMLASTDWKGGLRDRDIVISDQQKAAVMQALEYTIKKVKSLVFPIHGLKP